MRVEWVYTHSGRLLHAVDATTLPAGHTPHAPLPSVALLCGRPADGATLPDVFAKLGAKRCETCCKRADTPTGIGHPVNGR